MSDRQIGPEGLVADDKSCEYHGASAAPSADLVQALEDIRSLPVEHRRALGDWFFWHNRDPLYRIGLTDAEVGSRRVVPDDIWPDEADYASANDGTLEFVPGNVYSQVRIRLNETWQTP